MNDLIGLYVQNAGKEFIISKEHRLRWLLYTSLTSEHFRLLDEMGFVFVKRVNQYNRPENRMLTYVKKLFDKSYTTCYSTEELIMKPKAKRSGL